jgi:hypothetical protein
MSFSRASRTESFLFDKSLTVLVREIDKRRMVRMARKKFEKYQDSVSVFVRCAILRQLREDEAE